MSAIEVRLRAGMAAQRHHRRDAGRDRARRSPRSRSTASPSRTPPASRCSPTPRLPEGAPPGGLHLRAAQQPADGLLPPGHAGQGRAAPRRRASGPIDVTRASWPCTLEDGRACGWGCATCAGLREEAGERIGRRARAAPFASLAGLVDRARRSHRDELRALAEAGALQRLRPHAAQRAVAGGAAGRPRGPLLAASSARRRDGDVAAAAR